MKYHKQGSLLHCPAMLSAPFFFVLLVSVLGANIPIALADQNSPNQDKQTLTSDVRLTKVKRSHRRFSQRSRFISPSDSKPVQYRLGLVAKPLPKNILNYVGVGGIIMLEVFGDSCDQPLKAHLRIIDKQLRYRYLKFEDPVPVNSDWNVSVEYLGKQNRKHTYRIQLGEEQFQVPLDFRVRQIQQDVSGAELVILKEVLL